MPLGYYRYNIHNKRELRNFLVQNTKRLPKPAGRHYIGVAPFCRIWTGKVGGPGYPRIMIKRKHYSGHRLVARVWHGIPQPGDYACHKCDNRRCLNPKHIYWGSQKDNMKDAQRRERTERGEDRCNSILTESDVLDMLEVADQYNYEELGSMFGVHGATARDVVLRNTWRHVA